MSQISKFLEKTSKRQLLITLVPSLFILFGMLGAHFIFNINFMFMMMDVAAIAGIHPLSGILSNLGILLWCSTAAICFFSFVIMHNCTYEARRFLFFSFIVSTIFMFDDFFQIHENLFNRYFGVSEIIYYIALAIFLLAYFIASRRTILQTDFGILLLSLAFFAISLIVDISEFHLSSVNEQYIYFFEEEAKWLGITCWCSYYTYTSYQFVISALCRCDS
jgi:hypothetical protein